MLPRKLDSRLVVSSNKHTDSIISKKKTAAIVNDTSIIRTDILRPQTITGANVLSSINYQNLPKDTISFAGAPNVEGDKSYKSNIEIPGKEGISVPLSLVHKDGIFGLLLLCFLLFSYFYKRKVSFFKENSRLLFSSKSPNLFDETTASDFWHNFVLVFQTILLASTILFCYFGKDNPNIRSNYLLIICTFVLSIYLLIVFKYLFYLLIQYLFDIDNAISNGVRSYLAILKMLGVIAFIPSLILLYSDSYDNQIYTLLISLFIVSRLIFIYRITAHFLEEKVNFLFLITYLCTIEILPYVFLYKGLIYLYEHDITNIL